MQSKVLHHCISILVTAGCPVVLTTSPPPLATFFSLPYPSTWLPIPSSLPPPTTLPFRFQSIPAGNTDQPSVQVCSAQRIEIQQSSNFKNLDPPDAIWWDLLTERSCWRMQTTRTTCTPVITRRSTAIKTRRWRRLLCHQRQQNALVSVSLLLQSMQ